MTTIRAARFERSRFELLRVPRPKPRFGEVIVEVYACGICGSDLHYFGGEVPGPAVCPGHEICGRVAPDSPSMAAGAAVVVEPVVSCRVCRHCCAGEPNLCPSLQLLGTDQPGGFADVVAVPADAVYALPPGLDLATAVLTEPVAVAVHAIRLAPVQSGTEVLVIGGGTIGLLTAFVAARIGAVVTIAVHHSHQGAAATRLGAREVFDGSDALVAACARHQPEVVFETVGGQAATLMLALSCVRPGGSIVMLGVFSKRLVLDPLLFLAKEVRITSSMMYSRKAPMPDFVTALEILRDERERLATLVTHHVALDEIQRAFSLAKDKRSGAIKVAVYPTPPR